MKVRIGGYNFVEQFRFQKFKTSKFCALRAHKSKHLLYKSTYNNTFPVYLAFNILYLMEWPWEGASLKNLTSIGRGGGQGMGAGAGSHKIILYRIGRVIKLLTITDIFVTTHPPTSSRRK